MVNSNALAIIVNSSVFEWFSNRHLAPLDNRRASGEPPLLSLSALLQKRKVSVENPLKNRGVTMIANACYLPSSSCWATDLAARPVEVHGPLQSGPVPRV